MVTCAIALDFPISPLFMAVPVAREELEQLASKLQMIWESPDVEMRVKKRIVRTLIKEIVVDVDSCTSS